MRPGRPGSSTRIPKAERRIAGAQLYGLAFTIKIIKMGGHRIKGHFDSVVQPVDMFPWTGHVETVVQLSKGNISSQNVRVEFSLEDMDMSRFQQGATYEQIQDWVQEKYGFHVTHLNIAKTKRKYGSIEKQKYNLPKSEANRSSKTPKEKKEQSSKHSGIFR